MQSVLPWFWPGVAVSVLIAIVLGRPLGRRLGVGPLLAGAIIVGTGAILAATLSPLRGEFDFDATWTATCDMSRIGFAPIREILRVDDTSLNILLFIPLGIAIGLVPPRRSRAILIGAAFVLPFAIETIQLVAPILDRGCQSADVFDNLSGLFIGLVMGAGFRVFVGDDSDRAAVDV